MPWLGVRQFPNDPVIGTVLEADGDIVSVRLGVAMASTKRNTVEIDLTGAETATATVMQMADALQADTVKMAEQARQLRAVAHEGALILHGARLSIRPPGRMIRTEEDIPTLLETVLYNGELDISTIQGAQRLLEALQLVETDRLDALIEWRDGYKPRLPLRNKRHDPEFTPAHLKRGITVSGAFLQPKHGDDPKGDGDTLRVRIRTDPSVPPHWFNLATIILLARIGARAITIATGTDADYEQPYQQERD
jgi:hypothetical protein